MLLSHPHLAFVIGHATGANIGTGNRPMTEIQSDQAPLSGKDRGPKPPTKPKKLKSRWVAEVMNDVLYGKRGDNFRFSSIGDILELLVNREWDSFRSSALSSRDIFYHLDSAVSSCSQLNGMTVLHAVVRYNPPLDLVEQIIEYCPDMPAARDCLNRTPLHVAAGSGASAGLLNILARAHPEACDVQDDGGKTPLHVACDSACVLFEEDNNVVFYGRKQPPNHDAVSILLSYSFQASLLRDDEGMSPRDLAIQSNARGSTVCLLGYCQDLAWRHEQQLQRERQQEDYYDYDVNALVASMASMSVSSAGSDSTFSTLNTDTSWDSE